MDGRRGARFEARCLDCGEGYDDFVVGLGIGNKVAACQRRRNAWAEAHARATGHLAFELVNIDYRRLEILLAAQPLALEPERKELEP